MTDQVQRLEIAALSVTGPAHTAARMKDAEAGDLRILLVEEPERLLSRGEGKDARRALPRLREELREELPLLLRRQAAQVGARRAQGDASLGAFSASSIARRIDSTSLSDMLFT